MSMNLNEYKFLISKSNNAIYSNNNSKNIVVPYNVKSYRMIHFIKGNNYFLYNYTNYQYL